MSLSNSLAGSPTLRHLEQLVDGLTAGVILVDPSGTILSANPAALEMHGVPSLAALGETADAYCHNFCLRHRSGARLARREYPIIRMLAGESFPDQVVDVAPADEEPRWTHSVHDVVMDEDGGEPDVLALVIQDVSERYDAEARFEAMFQANPAPAVILRLEDQRFIRANAGFLELTGHGHDRVVGRHLRDFDILARAERRAHVAERMEAGATIPQVEAELSLPDGDSKLVILAGQPIEVADQRCMLFTFADLEPRRRAERALRASERHFQAAFRMAPVAMAITAGEEQRFVEVNEAFRRLVGRSSDELLGRSADEVEVWDDPEQRRTVEGEIAKRGGLRNRDVRLRPKDAATADCLLSAERIALRGDQCVLWLYQDITQRRHSELALVEAIEAVMKDASWFSRSIMDKLATLRTPTANAPPPPQSDLSRREREVLELIALGLDDRAIAERLGLSGNTVRNHVSRLYAKIGVNRRSAAVIWARERGIGGGA
ncbi:PAS domain S-box protein [Sphingomonas sp.]|jgi:PAS domain S-box-containing protein|uniref:PAS domain S-box protein n=1 Tax=Sphingomonas sp. TaxID=28214 RepID=UPI002D8034DE|nr:PAS domain S-box protein [Sphingomonas sp.]HEU0045272.1 PAS domain S-box protein [Sphingomonas sp.]